MNIFTEIMVSGKTFIIAEIGQNHQGNLDTAKQLIQAAKVSKLPVLSEFERVLSKEAGADCVKFQKTCLQEKFTKSALDSPYCSVNSWGSTYREHKTHLEFSDGDFLELQAYAKVIKKKIVWFMKMCVHLQELHIHFTASAMDERSFDFLTSLNNVPFIKIGSGDVNNLFLLEKAAKSGLPLLISTGVLIT